MPDVDALFRRFGELKKDRTDWEDHWQDLAENIIPRKANIITKDTPGSKKMYKVYDSTAIQANELFASSLHGMMVNYAAQWFELQVVDDDLNNDTEVAAWLQDSTERMHAVIHNPDSRFSETIDEFTLDIGSFGTSGIAVDESDDHTVIFQAWNVGQVIIDENKDGVVDTVYIPMEWTPRKIKQRFKKVPDYINKARDDEKFLILRVVMPNDEYDPEKKLSRENRAFVELFVDEKTKTRLEVTGYHELPLKIGRWRKQNGEIYGRSPGMVALPDVRMLNAMEKSILIATEKAINPPLQIPSGFEGRIKSYAGAANYRIRGAVSGEEIKPIAVVGNIPIAFEMAQAKRLAIRQAFYNDQLQLNLPDSPQMTKFEVAQRQNEKMRLMMPMLGRVMSEAITPVLNRVFNIMLRKNQFKTPPKKVLNQLTKIRYMSQMARAQASTEVDAIINTLGIIAPMMEIDPQVIDNFDMDEASLVVARNQGWPSEAIRDSGEDAARESKEDKQAKTRKGRRDARQQAFEQQQQMEIQAAQAETTKKQSEASRNDRQ